MVLVNSTQLFVLATLTQPIGNLETFGDSILVRTTQSELLFHGPKTLRNSLPKLPANLLLAEC